MLIVDQDQQIFRPLFSMTHLGYNASNMNIVSSITTEIAFDTVRPIEWIDGGLKLLDQRYLPGRTDHLILNSIPEVAQAITDMVVRGAPAIGITAAYAVVLGAQLCQQQHPEHWQQPLENEIRMLAEARPTAINLHWAIEQMRTVLRDIGVMDTDAVASLLNVAKQIHAGDIAANRTIGAFGAGYLGKGSVVLTHCNAGALATGGYGTAIGVIRSAYALGKVKQVFADETRPWLQGARLTAWELEQEGIPVQVLVDGAASFLMQQRQVDWVIVGSDRIAANGDVANKIGTYALAVAAKHHGVRFMVAAPTSTIAMETATGENIPIEKRDAGEILNASGVTSSFISAWNPVFDVTPAALVDVIVTEKGVIEQPDPEKVARLMAD
jgi:methylthioribose-1-phosphate isomerase